MPTVTISGGGYSALVQYATTDAYNFATALGKQISSALSAGTLTNFNYTADFNTQPVAGGPASGFGGMVTFASGTSGPVQLAATDSVVVVTAPTAVQIQGGAASVIAGSGGLSYTNITAPLSVPAVITAGDGANLITTAQTGAGSYSINTGSANDTVGIFAGSAVVNAARGSNLIVLGGTATAGNNFVFSEGYDSIVGNTVVGGGGTDTVDIGSGQATINPGSSNFFVFGGTTNNTTTYLAGTGSATVAAGLGASTVTGGLAGKNLLVGGLSYGGTVLTGGGNGDQLFAVGDGAVAANAGSGSNVTISGAGGPATLLLGYAATVSTANNLFVAGSGNDTLLAGRGADTLVGGSGTSFLVSGTGADTFSFIKGQSGGSSTISGFKGTDTLQLTGYGLSPTVAGGLATASGSGTVVSLNDGTRITLQGVGSLSTGQIKTS